MEYLSGIRGNYWRNSSRRDRRKQMLKITIELIPLGIESQKKIIHEGYIVNRKI